MAGTSQLCQWVKEVNSDEFTLMSIGDCFFSLLPPYPKMRKLDGRRSKVRGFLCVKVT